MCLGLRSIDAASEWLSDRNRKMAKSQGVQAFSLPLGPHC